jgi:hypothetical protein
MLKLNFITVILITVFALPIIFGAFQHFSRESIKHTLRSLFDNLEFLVSLFLAIYMTRRVFFDNDSGVFNYIYNGIPKNITTFLYGQDVIIYIIVVPIILLLVRIILRLFTRRLFNACSEALANGLYTRLDSMGSGLRHIIGALSQVPRAVFLIFIFGLLINFYSYYFPSPFLSRTMNQSVAYQVLYKNAVCPVLNSNIAKKIPVLVNDSFGRSMERVIPQIGDSGENSAAEQLVKQLKKSNIRVITYFNGVTLDEAIKSNSQIDETARKIVGSEENSKKKAYLIYKWVSQNMQYDYEKAAMISKDPTGISSGSIIAFNTRKGICFDYSSLYISMCREAGVKVRLITGLGYSGVAWGDHAWNQVYCVEEGRWVNVDTTFGTNGNYFDKVDFNVDHRYAEVQGEW